MGSNRLRVWCVVVAKCETSIIGCFRANIWLKTVSVSALASARAVFRCAHESFMLTNSLSREIGRMSFLKVRTRWLVLRSMVSWVVQIARHLTQARRRHTPDELLCDLLFVTWVFASQYGQFIH